MRVNASLPSYKQIEVELNPNKTAKDLKAIICKKLGIEPELTRLLAHGKPLPDHTPLCELRKLSQLTTCGRDTCCSGAWKAREG